MGRDIDVIIYSRGLRAQGWTLKAIGQEIGKSRQTASEYCDLKQAARRVRNGKSYYKRNKSSVNERNQQNYRVNRATVLERTKAYAAQRPELYREANRQFRAKYPEKCRQWSAQWRQQNPEKSRALVQRRRARKASVHFDGHTAADLARHREFWSDRCAYCFDTIGEGKLHWDHIVPLCAGGAHTLANLVPSCSSCNRSKHSKPLAQWLWPERSK